MSVVGPGLTSDDYEQLPNRRWRRKGQEGQVGESPSTHLEARGRDGTQTTDREANRLVRLIEDKEIVLFHDSKKMPFARLHIENHFEIWPCRSKQFKVWLAREFWQREEKSPNSDAINSALNVIEGKACFDGGEFKLHNRVAEHDDAFWYDLTDERWRAVRITPAGWQIIETPPILFQRHTHQAAQVEPIHGGNPKELLRFVNLRDKRQELLLLIYVTTCFVPDIPHPIAQLYGEKGSAKTTLFALVKSLVDPSAVKVLSFPASMTELVQKLSHHWVAFFDNITHMNDRTSDALCRASTGEGFTKRELYSDDSDVIYAFRRCVGLNGVNVAAIKPDLLDRVILFELERIPYTERREERELFNEFGKAKPRILGGFLDVLSKALAIYPSLRLKALPRMADFARWGCAIAMALGYSPDDFLEAYGQNIDRQNEEVLTSNPVAIALLAFMEGREDWQGTPSELFEGLSNTAEECKVNTKTKVWPGAPHILSRRLNEVRGNLREGGIIIEEMPRTGREGRRLVIRRSLEGRATYRESKGNGDTNDTSDHRQAVADTKSNRHTEPVGDANQRGVTTTATPVATPQFLSGDRLSQIRGDTNGASDATFPTPSVGNNGEVEKLLGMGIDHALAIWRNEGAPVIHLGPGKNCFDLERLLAESPKARHLGKIREWLERAKKND